MSWEHGTYGWEKFECFIRGLETVGIPYNSYELKQRCHRGADALDAWQNLRVAYFTTVDGKSMIVEEYLAVVDCDCDGSDIVDIAVYEVGQRPELETEVLAPR